MLWIFDIFPHYRYQIPACSDLWSWDAGIKLGSNQKHLLWSLVWEPEIQSSREYLEFILARIKSEAVDPISWGIIVKSCAGCCQQGNSWYLWRSYVFPRPALCAVFSPRHWGMLIQVPSRRLSILNFSSPHFPFNPHSTGSVHRYVIVPGTEQN